MERTTVGDVVIIRIKTKLVLTGNTLLRLKYEKPNGSCGHWAASVNPDNTTKAQYMTTGTDLDIHGTWKVQVYVEFADWRAHSLGQGLPWVEFKVYKPLC